MATITSVGIYISLTACDCLYELLNFIIYVPHFLILSITICYYYREFISNVILLSKAL